MRAGFFVLLLFGACAGPSWRKSPHDVPFQRTPPPVLHEAFETRPSSEAVEVARHSAVRPLGGLVSPGAYAERAGARRRALDVNEFGQVTDSSWFTNRVSRRPWSAEELRQGPNTIDGPAEGPLRILGGKIEGVAPGFVVEDQLGRRFVVKLDHPAYPGLGSGAEVVATKILHALGYNVPENYVVTFDLERLFLSEDASTAGKYGRRVPLDRKLLDDILSNANPFPDGTVRALFSRIIEGEVLGSFEFEGFRREDPNDRIPHERRRSLRALRMFYAWLNNTDARSSNTLDVFIPSDAEGQLGSVRHYLLDFGDALGSAGTEPKYIAEGYEGLVDLEFMAYGLFSLGAYYRYWLPVQRSPFRSVGTFEAQVFDPAWWRPAIPNPAFQELAPQDAYWAAVLMARFSPDLVAAAVDAAGYDTNARAWVLRVLLERQFKLIRWGFGERLPLEDRRMDEVAVRWTDLAVELGLVDPGAQAYTCQLLTQKGGSEIQTHDRPLCELAPLHDQIMETRDPFMRLEVRRRDLTRAHVLHLRRTPAGLLPVAVRR
ncbi:MAG: hypothetical protein AAGD10_04040 [Myxococcota bacterium]